MTIRCASSQLPSSLLFFLLGGLKRERGIPGEVLGTSVSSVITVILAPAAQPAAAYDPWTTGSRPDVSRYPPRWPHRSAWLAPRRDGRSRCRLGSGLCRGPRCRGRGVASTRLRRTSLAGSVLMSPTAPGLLNPVTKVTKMTPVPRTSPETAPEKGGNHALLQVQSSEPASEAPTPCQLSPAASAVVGHPFPIATRATIPQGVTIGDGTEVAAGAGAAQRCGVGVTGQSTNAGMTLTTAVPRTSAGNRRAARCLCRSTATTLGSGGSWRRALSPTGV